MADTNLPVLVLNNIILFPHSEIRLEVEGEKEKELFSLAEAYYNKHILIVHKIDTLDTSLEDFPEIGVIGYISMKLDLPNQKTKIVIKGMNRVKIVAHKTEDNILNAQVEAVTYKELNRIEEIAYSRSLIKQVEFYLEHNPSISNSILSSISQVTDLDKLTDLLAAFLPLSLNRKLAYLLEVDPTIRVMMLLEDIKEDLQIIELEEKINEEVTKNIERSQKEYLLQEKLKVIKEELGIKFDKDEELDSLKTKINALKAPFKIKDRLLKEFKRLETLPATSPEIGNIRNYIDVMLSLPWNVYTTDNKDLKKAKEILDSSHFALDKVKDRILNYLALLQLGKGSNAPILCLVGPPGVGKTTLAKSIAKAMGRNYVKISVGGVNDEADIIGHRRAYISSSFGKIIGGMKRSGSSNPVFVIDEIDKMTKDIKGDPASCLLEVLDKEQNKYFVDNFIEEEFDLSKVLFVCTANYEEQIPLELYDRMEIIHLTSYSLYEKLEICKKYIIPKLVKQYNLQRYNILFLDEALIQIIDAYTKEAGVRELERMILAILMKIAKDILLNKSKGKIIVKKSSLYYYLGPVIYQNYLQEKKSIVGVTNAMSYTIFGGYILKIEVAKFKGSGKVITTGCLGDVFTESINIALSYIKSNCANLGISYEDLVNSDLHLHVPFGAVKKDGPSAGVAITTAIVSLFTNKAVPTDISMTGEMTLRGEVLPVGGLKEKILGAKKNKIKTIFLPAYNKNDLQEFKEEIKDEINFVLVTDYQDIYNYIFSFKR